MAAPPPAAQGRIFISYRREETAYPAGWLYDRLADRYGHDQVFKDVDSIQLGDDFVEVITRAVGSCDVLLALIGDEWLTVIDAHGRRRLDDPDDFVRVEIEAALTRKVRVIPILVDGAGMPHADELPPSLAKLVRRQALELSPTRFEYDTSRLLRVLDTTLAEMRTAQGGPAAMRSPAAEVLDLSTTEVHDAPERLEEAGQSLASHLRPAAPVVPTGAGAPSDGSQSPDKQRRRSSGRGRALAGLGIGVALILLVIVIIIANSGTTAPPRTSITAGPSPTITSLVPRTTNVPTLDGVRRAVLIMEDDFSTMANRWDVVDDRTRRIAYSSEAYELYAKTAIQLIAFPRRDGQLATGDVLLEVDGRLQSGKTRHGYGLVCKYTDLGNLYRFNITNDGHYGIIKVSGRTEKALQGATPSDAISPTKPNHIQALCVSHADPPSTELSLWVNGSKVKTVVDSARPLPNGTRVGIYARDNSGGGTTWIFDNFRAWRLQ
jgi:hypothetical protein